MPEAGVEKCLCGGDCQIADCQPIARSTCTTVGFWKATGVQCRSGNRLPEALRGRFMRFRRTGYFQRRFSGGSQRDKLLAITPNVDYAAGWTFGVTAYDLSHQGSSKNQRRQSLHLYCCFLPLKAFLTTFVGPQKKHFFYHISDNLHTDMDFILPNVHPACFAGSSSCARVPCASGRGGCRAVRGIWQWCGGRPCSRDGPFRPRAARR